MCQKVYFGNEYSLYIMSVIRFFFFFFTRLLLGSYQAYFSKISDWAGPEFNYS